MVRATLLAPNGSRRSRCSVATSRSGLINLARWLASEELDYDFLDLMNLNGLESAVVETVQCGSLGLAKENIEQRLGDNKEVWMEIRVWRERVKYKKPLANRYCSRPTIDIGTAAR